MPFIPSELDEVGMITIALREILEGILTDKGVEIYDKEYWTAHEQVCALERIQRDKRAAREGSGAGFG